MEEAVFRNKAAVMAALAAAGITSVTVAFDGYGDDGQIESIVAQSGELTVQLPDGFVAIVGSEDEGTISSGEEASESHGDTPLTEAIESLCYEYLEEAHSGWEVNDGAYGTFVFTVADGSVVLDFNLRFSDSENYEHRF
jgi:hypothetical protein